jgi:hypothetical protein
MGSLLVAPKAIYIDGRNGNILPFLHSFKKFDLKIISIVIET